MPYELSDYGTVLDGSTPNTNYRIVKVEYGDGNSQRMRDGINNKIQSWNVKIAMDNAGFATFAAALDAAAGADYFTWTPPSGTETKWMIEGWSSNTKANTTIVSCQLDIWYG